MAVALPEKYEPYRRMVEAWLTQYLESWESRAQVPNRLMDAVRSSWLAPGKRIRPILTLLTAECCNGIPEKALPAAAAVEMIHAYSLVHDDLPAMDDDALRRGRPTCHIAFDEGTAILAGDALLTLAFQVLAEEITPEPLAASCLREVSMAAGWAGMVGGQMDDLLMESNQSGTLKQLISIHRRKTGALLQASVLLGWRIAQFAQPDTSVHAALCEYADNLGLAFQIADDLLDVQSSSQALGKATQKDASQGKLTYPGLLGVDGARRELQMALQKGGAALEPLYLNTQPLVDVLHYVVNRDK